MNIGIALFLLIIMPNIAISFDVSKKLKSKSEKLKKKMKDLMGNKKGDELLLDINELEYPGANESLREIHRKQWLEYYECLKDRYVKAGSAKTMYPISIMALEGTFVELECSICISPAETHMIESVDWYFNSSRNSSNANEIVELTEHTLISPDDKSLLMYNIQVTKENPPINLVDQAGQYWCKLGNTIAPSYFVHVDNGSEPTQTVRPNEASKAAHASQPTIISRCNLKAYSSWTEWTECSTCNRVGKRMRYGYCTISLIEYSADEQTFDGNTRRSGTRPNFHINKRDVEDDIPRTEKDSNEIMALAEAILPVFRNKLPCRSEQTPKVIQDLEEIKNRKTEIMVQFCKVKCQKNVIFEVRDETGEVLESANNSAGIYSMLQGYPEPPPITTRITTYEKHGKKATLKCPGNLNTDAPVIWQIRNKIVNPILIAEQTKNRIYVSTTNELIIMKLLFADANIYSCWQTGELAGTIRLEVTQDIEIKFDHHVFMVGAILILSVFLYVFWRAFKGRKRITKH
ncbi:uncharacterized protein LOC125500237 isoform X2 [Athalia rosae]|uniref:uncharacterized protein LOC125500237 isoform X2 n=1 Tax=Athalia rosae TaxID=37344 RepID=UPI002034A1EF|nr:uncharacterized protein LOC125500237 isoform X2 [Athalia rosae]